VPVVLLAALFAAAQLLLRIADGPAAGERRARFARLWLGCALALAAAFCAQELLEGWLSAGHPAGAAALISHGGWIGPACTPVVGALIALAARGAAIAAEPAAPVAAWRPQPAPASALASPAADFRAALDPLARFLAARGPPRTSV